MSSLRSVWEFFVDISEFFRTILIGWWTGFLLPIGFIAAIAFGGWLYFLPFLAANAIVAYKFNRARRAQRLQLHDDKSFTKYKQSLEEYVELVKKSKTDKEE